MKRGHKKAFEYHYDIPLSLELIKENNYTIDELIQMHKLVDGVYQCRICSTSFAESGFGDHLRHHTTEWVGHCQICSLYFTRQDSHDEHMKRHRGPKKYRKLKASIPKLTIRRAPAHVCGTCGQKFKMKFRLKRHLESGQCSNDNIAKESTSNDVENESNNSMPEVVEKKQENIDPTNDKFKCTICRVSFQTYYKFSLHNKNFKKFHKLNGDEDYRNSLRKRGRPKKSIKNSKFIKRKKKKRGRVGPFSFDTEDESNADLLGDIPLTEEIIKENNHTLKQVFMSHRRNSDRSWSCKVCGKTYAAKYNFIDHLRKYTGDYVAHCDVCNQSFVRLQGYQDHMSRHATLGAEGTSTSGALINSDDHSCKKCGRTFKWKLCWMRHLKKNNCLQYTPVKIKNNNNKTKFVKIKKENSSKSCQFCGLIFKRLFYLEAHLRKFHENQIDVPKLDDENDIKLTEESIRERGLTINDLYRMHKVINDMFKCKVCHKHVGVLTFMDHLRFHTGDYVAFCKMCNRGFNTKLGYQLHMKKHIGSKNGPIKRGRQKVNPADYVNCDICRQTFKGEIYLKKHLEANKCSPPNDNEDIKPNTAKMLYQKPKRFMCQICRIYFRTNAQVEMHNANSNEQHAKFAANQSVDQAQMSNYNNKIEKKRFRSCFRLFSEPSIPIGDIPLTNKVIKENKYTLQQVFECHEKIDDCYTCKVCGKILKSRVTFIIHLRKHTGDWVAYCKPCEQGFSRSSDYESHQKQHNDIEMSNFKLETLGSYKCEKCGYNFKTKMGLVRHLMKIKCNVPKPGIIKRGPRRFKCNKCKAKYNSELQLTVHYQNTHAADNAEVEEEEDEQELTMDIIKERNLSLLEVFRMHAPVKDLYQCKICSKYLSTKTFLDHLRIHTGDFLKFCKICNKGFNTANNYSLHMNRHKNNLKIGHIGRPKSIPGQVFTCVRCERHYKSKGQLLKHIKLRRCGKRSEKNIVIIDEQELLGIKGDGSRIKRNLNRKKQFKCHICRLWFDSKYKLQKHDDSLADYHEMKEYEMSINKKSMRQREKNRNETYCRNLRSRTSAVGTISDVEQKNDAEKALPLYEAQLDIMSEQAEKIKTKTENLNSISNSSRDKPLTKYKNSEIQPYSDTLLEQSETEENCASLIVENSLQNIPSSNSVILTFATHFTEDADENVQNNLEIITPKVETVDEPMEISLTDNPIELAIHKPIKKIEISEPYAATDFIMPLSQQSQFNDQLIHHHSQSTIRIQPPEFFPPPPPLNLIPPYYCSLSESHLAPTNSNPFQPPNIPLLPPDLNVPMPILHRPNLRVVSPHLHGSQPNLHVASPHLHVASPHLNVASPHLHVSPPIHHVTPPLMIHHLPPAVAQQHFTSNAREGMHISDIKSESNRYNQFNDNSNIYSNSKMSIETNNHWDLPFTERGNNLSVSNVFTLANEPSNPYHSIHNDSDDDVMIIEPDDYASVIMIDDDSEDDKKEFIDIMSLSRYEE